MTLKQLGPYQISKLLGQGGMGAVYSAIDQNTGEKVAVKAIPSAKSQQEVFQKRFGSEITALKKLRHANIVKILGYGSSQGYLFMAMELVDGPSLYDYFRKKRYLPWAEVIGYMLDVCKGLKHAHDRGFIHRDLKLGNLLLDSSGQVKIADFGIARYQGVRHDELRENITAPGGVVGTYDYMAPEQLRGEAVTVRSDLYSLGVVMYVLLAGRTPFTFKNVNEAIDMIKTTEITPIGNLVPDLPPRLEKVVMRLLEKDPANRYASADTVYRRLIEIIDGDADVNLSQSRHTDEPPENLDDEEDFELSDEVHRRQTLVDGEPRVEGPTDPSQSSHSPPTEARQIRSAPTAAGESRPSERTRVTPKGDYYSAVTEKERGDDDWRVEEQESGPVWPYIVGLSFVLVLLCIGVYFGVLRKPTADQLHTDITDAVARGESPDDLEGAMTQFVEEFPNDSRAEEYRVTLTDLEARKLPRRLQMQLNWQQGESLSDEQRGFLDALSIAQTRPAEADERLRAVEALLAVVPDQGDDELLIAIRAQRRILAEVLTAQLTDRIELLDKLLSQSPDDLAKDDEAREVWVKQAQSAMLIYGEDTRLAEKIRLLQEMLTKVSSEPAAASGE